MKLVLFFAIFSSIFSIQAIAFTMKSGDLILEPISCYLCNLIEAEEESPYSHIGVLVFNQGNWSVLEAWGNVRMTPLNEFLSRKKKNTPSLVLRANRNLIARPLQTQDLLIRFENQFAGHSYDSQFLWNNSDDHGEKLYCSEFVVKFMEFFLTQPIPTKAMHFEKNRDLWMKFFHGNPPDGQPGLSPGDFEHNSQFKHVGYL